MTTGYALIIGGKNDSCSAYAPDLPGCVSTGRGIQEVERDSREAIEFHLDGMREDGEPIPLPTTVATSIAEVVTSK